MGHSYPMTPYRKGSAAGDEFYEAFEAWRSTPSEERGERPAMPENPYQLYQLSARRQWQSGMDQARMRMERAKREGR